MKNFLTVLIFALAFSLNAQNYVEHEAKAGETIESIAKKYLVTPFDILALNPDAKSNLKPGTVLIIPNSRVKNQPIEESSKELIGYKNHKVKRKETLYGISKKYAVTEDEIKKANRFLYSENLKKGQKLRIPRYKTFISKQTYKNTLKKYRVLPKEGKWRVAYKFGITVSDLEALNPDMNAVLQPGDQLNVPNIKNDEEKAVDTAYNYYEVLPKEGFYRLKIKTGLTQEQLEELNPELKETGLVAGMVLKIPGNVNTEGNLTDVETTKLESRLSNFKTKKLALMMPYKLHEIDVDSVEESKALIRRGGLLSIALDFHVGVTMALDSARRLGISTDLKVLDTRYQPSRTSKLLDENDFSDYDAVIGPLKEECFDRVAKNLRRDKVPVIAALNKPKEVYGNVFQTVPEDKLLTEAMINYVKRDSLRAKVVVISDQKHRPTAEMLKTQFPSAYVIYSQKDRKNKEKDAYFIYENALENVFPAGRTYVFLETDNMPFVSNVTSFLNSNVNNRTEIVLVTLDYNKAFEGKDIDNNNLSNLQFHYPSTRKAFDEYKSNSFVRAYKKEYGVSPSRYAARGFDVTLDLLLRLASEDNLYEASSDMIETEYVENKFRYNKSLFGGYTNQAIYIVKYDNLRIVEAK